MSANGCSSWPTPTGLAPARDGYNRAGNSDGLRGIEARAKESGLWPTPNVPNGGRSRALGTMSSTGATEGGKRQVSLTDAIKLWPTPSGCVAQDGETTETWLDRREREKLKGQNGNGMGMPLTIASLMWSTPQTADVNMDRGGDAYTAKKLETSPYPNLAVQARSLWATPATRDHKGENSATHCETATGRAHMDQLPNQVAHAFRLPDQPTPLHGLPSAEWRPTSRRLLRSVTSRVARRSLARWLRRGNWRKRRLNPLFVEWLMRWPPGHSLCACSETEWTLWLRHMRGAASQLPIASGPWIWRETEQMDLFSGGRPND